MSLDSDQSGLIDFYQRSENRDFLRSLEGLPDTLRFKGEHLLKLEYLVLKERIKNTIVKDYLEGEVQAVISEKQELITERERYCKLNEIERAL